MRAGRASSARHRLARPTPIRNGPQVVPVPGMPTCILLRTAERAVMLAVDSIAHRVPCVCTCGLVAIHCHIYGLDAYGISTQRDS